MYPCTTSEGGPVILVPAEYANLWRGTLPPLGSSVPNGWTWGKSGGPECDYDRACQPIGFTQTEYGGFGYVYVSGKPAIVLDMELDTHWIESGNDQGIVARNISSNGVFDEGILDGLQWKEFVLREIELKDGRLFMFDSAYEGNSDPSGIRAHDGVVVAKLTPGTYNIYYATYKSMDFMQFIRKFK
jgi:hypothetical protein